MIPDFSYHAANERTFLAWVRTAMALVGFGLAIAHLAEEPARPATASLLIAAGVLVIVLAYVRMHTHLRGIESQGEYSYASGRSAILLGAMIAALVLLFVVFLLHVF